MPLIVAIVRNFVEDIVNKRPRKGQSYRFCKRHQDTLKLGYLTNIKSICKRADNKALYRYFFDLIKQKIKLYDVQTHNKYNIDKKGCILGIITKQQRIFNKDAIKKSRILGHSQDSNREQITILVTVCTNSTQLLLGIIFASKTDKL